MSYIRGAGLIRTEAFCVCPTEDCEGVAHATQVEDHSTGSTELEGTTTCPDCGADLTDEEWEAE